MEALCHENICLLGKTMSSNPVESNLRPPPTGLSASEFRLCSQYENVRTCRLGSQCVEAHGVEELNHWTFLWNLRKDAINKTIEQITPSQSFLQKLQLQCSQSDDQQKCLVSSLPFVEVKIKDAAHVTLTRKPANTKWVLWVKTSKTLHNIALLEDSNRDNFSIHNVSTPVSVKHGCVTKSCQEWNTNSLGNPGVLAITLKFKATVYGTFSQLVILDFGSKPFLSIQLRVDVYPANEGLELSEDGKQLTVSYEQQWTEANAKIFRQPSTGWDLHNETLRDKYGQPGYNLQIPVGLENITMGPNHYKKRMHMLLEIEELAQARILSHFNLTGNVILTTHYILSPGPLSTAKYCNGINELFAKLELNVKVSEDTPAGRLILNNCNLALISLGLDGQGKRRAYECAIEDKTKDAIYLRLHEQMVADYHLKHGSEFRVQAQFQLNRDIFCEKHWAVDLCTPEILFPSTEGPFKVPVLDGLGVIPGISVCKLNDQQQQAVAAIVSNPNENRAPIVIAGPYGTGKTFTFAECIKGILSVPDTRVLVCTHSNSAADLYVKDYLHPLVQDGLSQYRPLRIFYRIRWLATVHHSVIEYSLLETDPTKGFSFRMPTREDIEKHRIVVTTLSTASYILQAGVKKGYFTHILIDEAAQCTECDVLLPISLADEHTRIALAGDHMQLSPEVFSQVAREQRFQVSLLERLYDLYPPEFPSRIVLCDNYRSHMAIVKFTSELFYDHRLKSVGINEQHAEFYPLTFQVAKGQDVQDANSTSVYNMAEIYEICEIVKKLQSSWPSEKWGRLDENSIGVVSPYSDQVSRLRVHLRHSKLFGVNVERVLNVQGKQYRVIILSTVRTRSTCTDEEKEKKKKKRSFLKAKKPSNFEDDSYEQNVSDEELAEDEDMQFGFLSSARLLNTAVTRARSLVVVVGDPLALCSVGKCRKLWERYLEVCRDSHSLSGISWMQLRSHLDAIEMKKLYGLNPMAPEFVPKVIRVGQPLVMTSHNHHFSSAGLPPFCPPPLPPSSIGTAAAGFPPFPPPPPFHPQWLLPCSPRRQPRMLTSRNNVQLSPKVSSSGPGAQLHELHSLRGFDVASAAPMNRNEFLLDSAVPSHRAISKPLTVQQLEAALLKKGTNVAETTPQPWTASPTNGSIWTPLSGPSLWDGTIFASKEEESNKNDSVPLYMRTSTISSSLLSDTELDLYNSFITSEHINSDEDVEDDKDIPLWADDNQEVRDEDLEDILECKTLQFEESVLRSLRSENLID